MKRLLIALIAIVFGFGITVSMADQREQHAVPVAKKTPTTWLFVLVVKKGKIVKTNTGYALVLKRKDLHTALMFSDRPARLTKHIRAAELQKIWKLGKNSFEKDPPNAAVTIGGKTQVVELLSMHVTSRYIRFPLGPVGKNGIVAVSGSRVVILIDGAEGFVPLEPLVE